MAHIQLTFFIFVVKKWHIYSDTEGVYGSGVVKVTLFTILMIDYDMSVHVYTIMLIEIYNDIYTHSQSYMIYKSLYVYIHM